MPAGERSAGNRAQEVGIASWGNLFEGVGIKVVGSEFGVQGAGCKVSGLGSGVEGVGCW